MSRRSSAINGVTSHLVVVFDTAFNQHHHRKGIDDVGFLWALIEDLVTRYPIDAERIFVTGISNGGHMSFRLACELAEQIVAFAPVTASMPVDIADECNPAAPVSLAIFNGTADPLVPYEGGQVRIGLLRRGRIMSSLRSL